jgi:hypothetical protein
VTRGLLYFTETSTPGQTPGSSQQFAVMRNNNRYFIGLEDRAGPITETGCGEGTCSDYDYNDLVFAVESQVVPEPATILLLGTGIATAIVVRRRRQDT